jgi:hypothetical protein
MTFKFERNSCRVVRALSQLAEPRVYDLLLYLLGGVLVFNLLPEHRVVSPRERQGERQAAGQRAGQGQTGRAGSTRGENSFQGN